MSGAGGVALAVLGVWLMIGFALWMMNLKAPKSEHEFESARRKMMRDNLGE